MSVTIDISEIIALGASCDAAIQAIPGALNKAGRASGLAVVRGAQSKAAVKTGNMKNQISVDSVDASASGVLVRVVASASSATGFPYPRSIEYGRRGFTATRAKVLVFPVNGKMVYTKRVGPAAAQPFMGPALTEAEPFIVKTFSDAYGDLLDIVGGS